MPAPSQLSWESCWHHGCHSVGTGQVPGPSVVPDQEENKGCRASAQKQAHEGGSGRSKPRPPPTDQLPEAVDQRVHLRALRTLLHTTQ